MANLLQVVGGVLVSGLLTGFFLVVVWGLIFFLVAKARDSYYHFRSNKIKHPLAT